jgi:phosphoserine phosphatase
MPIGINLCMCKSRTHWQALRDRLDLIQPRGQDVMAACQKIQLSPDVDRFVARLQALGKAVYLVSGGFSNIFVPTVSDRLNIPAANVYANRLLFDEQGMYVGFDDKALTAYSGLDLFRHFGP